MNSNGKACRNGKAILALFLALEPMQHSSGICCPSTWNSFPPGSHVTHSLTTSISVIKCGSWDPSSTLSETTSSRLASSLSPVLLHLSFVAFSTTWHFKCHWIPLLLLLSHCHNQLFSGPTDCSPLGSPPPGDLPNPGTEPVSLTSPALAGTFFTTSTTWETHRSLNPLILNCSSYGDLMLH